MKWPNLFLRRRRDNEFDRELAFHIEALRQENLARGMTQEEAHRQAMLEFGGREQIKEDLRDVHRLPMLETLGSNLRFALRLMRKSPVFSAAVVLTLALGIGANTAVFSAVDAVLLRPLPYPEPNQLVLVQQENVRTHSPQKFVAPVRLEDWNRLNSTFHALTGWYIDDASETSGPLPEKFSEAYVAPRFLQVWGVAPELGRDFSAEEEKFGGPRAVLISARLWRRRFHADPNAIGQQLHFGKSSATIVGVMPASFRFDRSVDLWSPVPVDGPYTLNRAATWYTVVGRLKPGVTLDQARSDLGVVQRRLGEQYPQTDADLRVETQSLKETTIAASRESLWLLFGAVTLLLLIACTNVAALLLARATEREHELGVRFSLGASRRAIVEQLLTEIFVLAVIGAGAGLWIASAAANVFRAMAHDLPRVDEIAINWRIAAYSLVCALVATFLCGMLPAWRTTRRSLAGTLASNTRTQVSGRSPMQWTLVGVQVALAVTLLVGAGLLLRSMQELGRVSPGFDPDHVLTLRVTANYGETVDMKALTQKVERMLDAIRAVPGVQAAATSSALSGVPQQFPTELKILEGALDPNRKIVADSRFVSAGYFATMRIPLLTGEDCRDGLEHGVLVNRSFADANFGASPAVGHHVETSALGTLPLAGMIRGVVADAREQGINSAPGPTVYWCMAAPMPDPYYLARTQGDPLALAETLRRAIHEVEPARSVFNVSTLNEHLSDAFGENRLRTLLLSLFALTAVSLACIGLYGTLSYLVTLRRREVGLRIALGAQRRQIVRRFLLQGLRVCAIGCACGLALAAASGRLLAGMLYGISPLDARTLSGVVALLLIVGACAALVPSVRAARTDPMEVLREG